MEKTQEQLLARKQEILEFLKKHYVSDPNKLENFITRFPDFSADEPSIDPSTQALEFEEYETNLGIEQVMENELLEIEDQLAKL